MGKVYDCILGCFVTVVVQRGSKSAQAQDRSMDTSNQKSTRYQPCEHKLHPPRLVSPIADIHARFMCVFSAYQADARAGATLACHVRPNKSRLSGWVIENALDVYRGLKGACGTCGTSGIIKSGLWIVYPRQHPLVGNAVFHGQ